jgi:predicted nucleic-acid-binding protein
MIGLDTNVLARYILQDDPKQSARAGRLIESCTPDDTGWVSTISIVELVWVMESTYELTRAQISQGIVGLLVSRELVVENAEEVTRALRSYQRSRADFADCLIAQFAARAGCRETFTFDALAARDAGMTLLK